MKKFNLFIITITFILITSVIFFKKNSNHQLSIQNVSEINNNEVVVYSARKEILLKDIFDNFTKETGIQVKLISDNAPKLIEKLEQEGELSNADVLITSDIAGLYDAKSRNLLSPVESEFLSEKIPAHLKDTDNQWFAFTKRVRAIFYNKALVKPEELSTYEDLANEKWNKKLLVRSSNNSYNQSLIASMIAVHGENKTLEWIKKLVANFARDAQGGDIDQLIALAAGEGSVAIANSYYFGRLLTSNNPDELDAAYKIAIFFPNQQDRGAHVNISGGGMTKYAKNRANAIKLLEFMATDYAQTLYADLNKEYPVVEGIKVSPIVADWGKYKEDLQNLGNFAKFTKQAMELADQGGWK